MSRRPLLALSLLTTGALALTAVSVPAAFAADATDARVSSTNQAADDSAVTVIVRLSQEPGDQASRYAEAKKRIGDAVAQAKPGSSIEDVRDYHHVFQGFAITAPRSTLAAIKATPGVEGAFVEGRHALVSDVDFWGINGGENSDDAPAMGTASQMTRANRAALAGEGQVVEVIDTRFDTSHEAFAGTVDAASLRLTKDTVAAVTGQLGAGKGGAWVSDKIPFAYDYGDGDADVLGSDDGGRETWGTYTEGTHAAALAAANGSAFKGAAPGAQLIVAKVTQDGADTASDSALLAALDDAAVLAPDVLTVSFATIEGMSSDSEALYSQVYQTLNAAGITVNAPAGNDGSGSYASDPDNGMIAVPASYSSTLAVASVSEQDIMGAVTFGDRRIGYRTITRMSQGDAPDFESLAEGTYRVVYARNGTTADLEKYLGSNYGDLSRTIILEDWGGTDDNGRDVELKHQLKNLKSLTSKPAGLMLAYVRDTDTPKKADVNRWFSVRAGTITKSDGDALREAIAASASGYVEVTVSPSATLSVPANVEASDFSSSGATSDLRLKPELAAPGGRVMAATPGNNYGRQSGTAEASAQVAGIAALVRQRFATDPAFAGKSAAEKNALVSNFLMGTAHPLADATLEDGTFYSPRRVGAGLVDAVAATTSPVYPTVVGAADPSRPKADLGDGTQGWTFQVNLTNVSDTAHTYSLGGQALSENVENGLFTRHATNWAGRGIDLTFSADSVTVPASSSATVTVTVTPREAFASYANATTPNGTFVDGAVTFTSSDGQPDLTVPYMGFYGSWGAPNVFDQQWPNNHKVGYGSTVAHGVMPFGQSNPFQEEDARMADGIDPDRVVISRSTEERARRSIGTETVLLRAVPSLTFTLTNEAGQTLRSVTCDRADKSVYDDHWRASHNVEFMSPGCAPRFDGYDADGNELPDGRYTVTIEASNYGPSAQTHRTSYSFWLDTAAPTVSNVSVAGEGDARTLSFDLTDSSPIAGYGFSLSQDGAVTMWHVEDNPSARADDGLFHQHYEVRLSEVTQALGENPSSLYLQAWDWPVNRGSAAVVVTPVAMTSLSVSPQAATMTVGDTATVRATHQPDDANVTDVVWSSSNEAVATVDQDGVVSAVGAGEATITVSDPTQPSVSASVAVRVSAAGPASQAGSWRWDVHGWWYRYEDGSYPSDTTLVLDGATYRFDAAGYMRTGWVSERGVWYYHHASGAQAKGWVLDGVHWYYMDPDTGAMVTGWLQVGSAWYYLSPSGGAMATGWLKEGGHWYYLDRTSGAMATGWLRIWGTWYHFADNGQLIG